MSKNYYENANLVNYIKSNIDEYSKVDSIYKPLLTDIMLRRISEFGFRKDEIFEDITALINNLNEIRIEDFSKRKGFEFTGGVYFPSEKAIALNKDYLNEAIETGDYTLIHEILTHEVFHVLSRTPEGVDKLSKLNRFTKRPNTALLECIIEKAADRCTFSRESDLQGNIPMFHKNKFGYTSITFAVDAISAAYGVNERAFLHNAVRGYDRMVEFLSEAGKCQKGETDTFLDKVDINLARLYNLDYNSDNNKHLTTEEKIKIITDSISGIYLACENNILNNIGMQAKKLAPTSLLERFTNTMLLSHFRLTKIITSACKNFSSRYEQKDVDGIQMINTVLSRNEWNSNEISNRFNQMQGVVTAMQKDPNNKDLRTLFNWAAYGNLNNYNSDKLIEFGIDIKNHSLIVNENVMSSFLHNDYEIVSWDNSIIQTSFAQIYKEAGKTAEKGFLDKVKGLFSRSKPLALGTHEDNIESENEILDLPVSENLYKLTPEELKKFNEGISEVIANQRKKDVQEVDEESKSNDSTSLDDWTN